MLNIVSQFSVFSEIEVNDRIPKLRHHEFISSFVYFEQEIHHAVRSRIAVSWILETSWKLVRICPIGDGLKGFDADGVCQLDHVFASIPAIFESDVKVCRAVSEEVVAYAEGPLVSPGDHDRNVIVLSIALQYEYAI